MEEIKDQFTIVKAVKKSTHNSVISKINEKINTDNEPVLKKDNFRIQSFKKITKFVPQLKPKKSTFMPTPLKLNFNKCSNVEEEEEEKDKQKSDDEIQIIDNEDLSSVLSNSSSEDDTINLKKPIIDKEKKEKKYIRKEFQVSSFNVLEMGPKDIEIKENKMSNSNLKIIRKKMSQLKAKAEINKFKETEEIVSTNFKKHFDFDMKDNENEDKTNIYKSINFFDSKKNINEITKTKSIFEVLSNGKKKGE